MKNDLSAAIILCAGKGTRMNDDSRNKVAFECAGSPVIRRIVDNMRIGGVSRFVIVVGHMAQSVMDCLWDEDGVIYAYQKEQKGTGHAAFIGLNALKTVGYSGKVIISMGDKVISPEVIAGLLERSDIAKAVWGVQPTAQNFGGGRVVVDDSKPCGVVELADAALMKLADMPENDWTNTLSVLHLNEKKAAKVTAKAKSGNISGEKKLGDKTFTADEILSTPYANAGLYCFDVDSALEAISKLDASNAQGEIYLTDTLESFAADGSAVLYEVADADDMRTFSTKAELAQMSHTFLRKASELIGKIESGLLDKRFDAIYTSGTDEQKKRYIALLEHFIVKYGDKPVIITRAPGRVNLMGRHIDHRGGGVNVMTIDRDTIMAVSPRKDDSIMLTSRISTYQDCEFSISGYLSLATHGSWLDYLDSEPVRNELAQTRGSWANYIRSAVLRFALAADFPICGMDIACDGDIPVASGLSSSSSVVVAAAEAVNSLNCLNLSDRAFIDLCGEGEWFVGSRGGAGDHAAMKCSKRGYVTHLGFKPFEVGQNAEFSDKYAVIVADSLEKANKADGARERFNSKVAAYEFALMLINKDRRENGFAYFRDITKLPESELYAILYALPEHITCGELRVLLSENSERVEQILSSCPETDVFDVRGVAVYGAAECSRSDMCMKLLDDGDYAGLGRLMKLSHDGDRLNGSDNELSRDIPLCESVGSYGCSTERVDEMCDILNGCDCVYGSEIVGAGLGGSVIALCDTDKSDAAIKTLNVQYYDKYKLEHSAAVYKPSSGSTVIY